MPHPVGYGQATNLVCADTVPHAVIHANHELTRRIMGKFFLLWKSDYRTTIASPYE